MFIFIITSFDTWHKNIAVKRGGIRHAELYCSMAVKTCGSYLVMCSGISVFQIIHTFHRYMREIKARYRCSSSSATAPNH